MLGVYPRVCGGASDQGCQAGYCYGLSPRVRGSQEYRTMAQRSMRSIPACAGEPRNSLRPFWPERVYPRVCGGASPDKGSIVAVNGLSPRVRGSLTLTPPLTYP